MEIQQETAEFLTVEELAKRWKVPTHWVYGNHKSMKIPTLAIGRGLRFPRRELEEWEAHNTRR